MLAGDKTLKKNKAEHAWKEVDIFGEVSRKTFLWRKGIYTEMWMKKDCFGNYQTRKFGPIFPMVSTNIYLDKT